MQLLFILIMLFNLAGLVGGVWLLFYGEWAIVLAGFLSGIISPYVLGLLIAPSYIFSIPAIQQLEKGNIIASLILGILSVTWTYLVLASWCVVVYYFAYSFSLLTKVNDYVPCMLFAFAVTMSPLKTMARADARMGSFDAQSSTFFFWIASIVVIFSGFDGLDLSELIWVYGITVVLLTIFMGFKMKRQMQISDTDNDRYE